MARARSKAGQPGEKPAATSPFRNAIVWIDQYGLPLPHEIATQELRENPDNWRRHPLEQLDAIEASIDEVGWIAGATINLRYYEDGWPLDARPTMIDGHGRAKVALRRGEATVPVGAWVRLTPDQERKALVYFDPITSRADADLAAYDALAGLIDTGSAALQSLIADTRESIASLDDMTGDDQADESGDDEELDDEDEPDLNEEMAQRLLAKWGCQTGDVWAIEGTADGRVHYLAVGDCTDEVTLERLFGERRAEVCITDPPYNVGIAYGEKVDDVQSRARYEAFSADWFSAARGSAGVQAVVFTPGTANLRMWLQERFIAALPLPYRWTCSWLKPNQCSSSALNGFNAWEPLLVFGKHVKPVGHDAWSMSVRQEQVGHPVPKTKAAWRVFVEAFSTDGSLVYEPFSGSGTTMLCCEELGRTCYAVEIEPKFAACTLERLELVGCACRKL